jgi:AAA+ ATPase superfamily predicted ATPase
MLFDLRPKDNVKDLFDREVEIHELIDSIEKYPLILVTGIRRIGKSSLVRTVIKDGRYELVYLDGRAMYAGSGGNIKKADLIQRLQEALSDFSNFEKIKRFLENVEGISLKDFSLSMNWKEVDLLTLIEKIEKYGQKAEKYIIFFFDEAQYLRYYGTKGGKDLLSMFSYMYDNFKFVKVILSGSEVGLLHDFLSANEYTSPIYGRYIKEISLGTFKREISISFLEKGFEEVKVEIDEKDIQKAIELFDGIPGYLVEFGNRYSQTLDFDKAMEGTFQSLSGMVKGEIEELRRKSERYIEILKYISNDINTWSALRNSFFAKGDTISDSRLYEALKNLEKMNWIKQGSDQKYEIIDDVLKEILKKCEATKLPDLLSSTLTLKSSIL